MKLESNPSYITVQPRPSRTCTADYENIITIN